MLFSFSLQGVHDLVTSCRTVKMLGITSLSHAKLQGVIIQDIMQDLIILKIWGSYFGLDFLLCFL